MKDGKKNAGNGASGNTGGGASGNPGGSASSGSSRRGPAARPPGGAPRGRPPARAVLSPPPLAASSSSPLAAPSSSLASPPIASASKDQTKANNATKNRYKRELTRERQKVTPDASGNHTPENSRFLALGKAAQDLGRYHEHATREHWADRARTKGPAAAALAASASQSRLGSAISVPEVHEEVVKSGAAPSGAGRTQHHRRKIQGTSVAIPIEYGKIYPESTVSLQQKGGNSTAYPVMAEVDVHPAKGSHSSHRVLTTLEGQRSQGRDAVSALSKGRLLQRNELTPVDAVAVDKHGSFELPGAQAVGDKAKATTVITRNTGKTVEAYGRSSSPRGRALFDAVEAIADPASNKRKRQESFHAGSRVIASIEPSIYDAPRTPPGSPHYHAADSHFGLSSPTPGGSLSSSPSSSRTLSPLRLPPAASPATITTQTTSSPSPLVATSPGGKHARKVARRTAPDPAAATPSIPSTTFPALPPGGFASSVFSLPPALFPLVGGPPSAFSSSSLSAFTPVTRSQPVNAQLSPLPSVSPRGASASGSASGGAAPGPGGSQGPAHGQPYGQPFGGFGAYSPFGKQ